MTLTCGEGVTDHGLHDRVVSLHVRTCIMSLCPACGVHGKHLLQFGPCPGQSGQSPCKYNVSVLACGVHGKHLLQFGPCPGQSGQSPCKYNVSVLACGVHGKHLSQVSPCPGQSGQSPCKYNVSVPRWWRAWEAPLTGWPVSRTEWSVSM